MKELIKTIGKCILILAIGITVGTLLLTLAFCLPVNTGNRDASFEELEKEGWYPNVPVLSKELDTYFHSYEPGVLVTYSDEMLVSTATDTSEGSPLQRAMKMYDPLRNEDYVRYWHGYVAILRPLMLIFDYSEIRVLNGICQMLLIFSLAALIWKKSGRRIHILILFTSYILLMPMALALCLCYSWVFYIAVIGAVVLLSKQAYFEQNNRYLYLFLILGMSTSYLARISYALFSWGFPLLWMLMLSGQESKDSHHGIPSALSRISPVILSGIGWLFGYAVMWLSKWVIGSIVLGENIFETAFEKVTQWSAISDSSGLASRFQACYINWKHYEYKIYMIILIAWFLVWVIKSVCYGFKVSRNIYAYLLTGFSSIVWYIVLSNHTSAHHLFTYRIYGISILAFLAIVSETVSARGLVVRDFAAKPKAPLLRVAAWCLIGVLALGISSTAREHLTALNGYCALTTQEIPEGKSLEVDFTPAYPEIHGFAFGMQSESTSGVYEVSLLHGDTEIDSLSVPIKELSESSYYDFSVDWDLDTSETYHICIEPVGNEAPVYAEITEPELTPLMELDAAKIGTTEFEGQPIMGITYNAPPVSRSTRVFQLFTWMAILSAFLTAGKEIAILHKRKKQNKNRADA